MIILLIHIALSILLFIITNWIGKHSYSIGYMEISMFVRSETAPAFNFVFRVISPIIYLIIISAIFYKINLDIVVKNIYLVSIYYIAFRILFNLITNRTKLLNWRRQAIHIISIIVLSYLTYQSIIKEKENILPDFESISNELWIIILLFLFQVLNNLSLSNEDTERRKENYLKSRYFEIRSKYHELIDSLVKNRKVEALIYSILIYEDFNRPRVARIIENAKYSITKKPMTLGIMQIKTEVLIDDYKSVEMGVKKIMKDLAELKESSEIKSKKEYKDWSILDKLISKYNGGSSYNSEVKQLFWDIWGKFYKSYGNDYTFDSL